MNLIEFIGSCPYEDVCRIKFKEFRDTPGVIYRKWTNNKFEWILPDTLGNQIRKERKKLTCIQ